MKNKVSTNTQKIIELNPELLFGGSNLFEYDSKNRCVALTSPFKELLALLVRLERLDRRALTVDSLYSLNAVLQQSQGICGGLLRKEGTERWHLEDDPDMQKYRQAFYQLFERLGFLLPKSIDQEISVDHCLIFGARTERMEKRIAETLVYLNRNLKVSGHIFLLGSNRKLTHAEMEHLRCLLEKMDKSQKIYWNEVFNDPEQSTEANAFVFLWNCIVPLDMQTLLENKLVGIKSARIGHSYNKQMGHRATIETTCEDWMCYYKADKPQAIFALAEQPYIRLTDQLRWTVLTKGKKAGQEELIERIRNTTFYFAGPGNSNTLVSVVLDEIGRNVYRTAETLRYLEGFK